MLVDVGRIVAEKYELLRLLGRGSMGEVWSAHHRALREQVALKLLTRTVAGQDAEEPSVALARFRFEAQVAARLSRKTRHIVRVTDYGEEDGLPYLVMELLDGEALDAVIGRRERLPLLHVAQIVSQIARALAQAHAEAVAHRDLKPANVFLTRDEEGSLLVKLLDFGIARAIHTHRTPEVFSTAKGFVFGTPGYMSPEQTRASSKLDHRCDLWALATIAYEMLTDCLPVDGDDAEEIMKNLCAGRIVPLRRRNPDLSEALGTFFDRAFADRLADRFRSGSALALAFEQACGAFDAAGAPHVPELATTTAELSADADVASRPAAGPTRAKVAVLAGGGLFLVIALVGSLWRAFASPPGPVLVSPNVARPSDSRASREPPAAPEHPLEPPPSTSSAVVPAPAPAVSPASSTRLPAVDDPRSATAPRASAPPRVQIPSVSSPSQARSAARPVPQDRNDVF